MKSIEQTMADLEHSYLSILKIDVEGSEWSAVAAMLESKKMRWLDVVCFVLSALYVLYSYMMCLKPTANPAHLSYFVFSSCLASCMEHVCNVAAYPGS